MQLINICSYYKIETDNQELYLFNVMIVLVYVPFKFALVLFFDGLIINVPEAVLIDDPLNLQNTIFMALF